MNLESVLRRRLPARSQDFLRTARDVLSIERRKQIAVSAAAEGMAPFAVSPDGRVLAGVFAGLQLPLEASWGGLSARLAGHYEREIAAAVRIAIGRRPHVIVDAGCAEGYYAVGMARALPESTVYAFDIDRRARKLCRLTARRNGVSNVRIRGRVDPVALQRVLQPGCLLISDVEGYEAELLDPRAAPVLYDSYMIVELHEFAMPGVTRLIVDRFTATHECELITAEPRQAVDVPHLAHLSAVEANSALQEGRPVEPHPQQWAVLSPLRRVQ